MKTQGMRREAGGMSLILVLLFLLILLSGCALNQGENRKITAWGIWAVPLGSPVGIGYWHSERGPDVKSEESAKPGIPKSTNP